MKKYILILVAMALTFSFSSCNLLETGDVVFHNNDLVAYACYIDGSPKGVVQPYTSLTVPDVSTGSIELEVQAFDRHIKNISLTKSGYVWYIDFFN